LDCLININGITIITAIIALPKTVGKKKVQEMNLELFMYVDKNTNNEKRLDRF
jgi:hypothetical protein